MLLEPIHLSKEELKYKQVCGKTSGAIYRVRYMAPSPWESMGMKEARHMHMTYKLLRYVAKNNLDRWEILEAEGKAPKYERWSLWLERPHETMYALQPPPKKENETEWQTAHHEKLEKRRDAYNCWSSEFKEFKTRSVYLPPPYGFEMIVPDSRLFEPKPDRI